MKTAMHAFSFILIAEHTRSEVFREGFRSRGATGNADVLLGLLIVAALVAGMWAISRLLGLRRRGGYNSPGRLFTDLCKAHNLNWSERWLLRRVARHQGLHDPGRLFLEAEHWEEKNLGTAFVLEYPRLQALQTRILGMATAKPSAEKAAAPSRPAALAAPPLFPTISSPTLDIPPWTAESSR
jgi:hypothetical protein